MSNDLRAPEFLQVLDAHGNSKYRMVVGWDEDNQRIIVTYSPRHPSFTALFYRDNTKHRSKFGAIQLFHSAFRGIEAVENEKERLHQVSLKYFQFVPVSPLSIPPSLVTPEDEQQRRAISPSLSSARANDSSGDGVELLQKMLAEAVNARATLEAQNLENDLRKDFENDYLKQIIDRYVNLFEELIGKMDNIPQEIIAKFETLKRLGRKET